ncbi:MAG: COX15/CtaA family protein [Planctomycetales bacterium]|nr:COX15/CtaA family protein [Planctomycetales bacterium]
MSNRRTSNAVASVWTRRLAIGLACATFPLIWVGGMVTTYDAGMAVPDWPSTYGYNLFLYPWSTWWSGPFDLFIEHGHRLLGAAVGMIAIAAAISAFVNHDSRLIKTCAIGCLIAVIAQGGLGGLRVVLNDTTVARLHSCTGQLFFCGTVGLVAVTSNWWTANPSREELVSRSPLTGLFGLTMCMMYLQFVLGSFVRHIDHSTTPGQFQLIAYAHVLLAMAIVLRVTWVFLCGMKSTQAWAKYASSALLALTLVQIGLGLATWTVNYGWPTFLPEYAGFAGFLVRAQSLAKGIVVTGHVATGSLLVATSFWSWLRSYHCVADETSAISVSIKRSTGAVA